MRVLIADDDSVTRKILEANLRRWGYDVLVCADGGQAWNALQGDDAVELAILDWMMPVLTGIEICRKARDVGREPYMYVILLTGKTEKEEVVEGLEAGADDYITKPFDPDELKVRVKVGARIVELQHDLWKANKELEFKATHDHLTSLWNRAAILERLRSELARSMREATAVGLIVADIDHFKCINDEHGHLTGDAVLREVAQKMASVIRPYDVIGRYGGEEFLIILPGCNIEEAAEIAERLRAGISGAPCQVQEGALPITVSFGVTSTEHSKQLDVDAAIQVADDALYEAKRKGRNRVEVSSRGIDM